MKRIVGSHYFKLVISAMFAGLIMALAAFELVVANKADLNLFYLGGFIQGFGILAVVYLGLNLFNCKLIGIFESKEKLKTALDLFIMLIVNLLTIVLVAVLLRVLTNDNQALIDSAKKIADIRVITIKGSDGKEWYDALIASLMCGFIVGIGLNIYKKVNSPIIKFLSLIFATGIYVVCGFEQIMTNMFYITFANMFNGYTVLDLFIVLVGNSLASILVYFGFKVILPNKEK